MILPAFVENVANKLKVNVMLHPCSAGSYITECVAEELHLNGDEQELTISGTGGYRDKETI